MTLSLSLASCLETTLGAVRLVLWVQESVPSTDRRTALKLDAHLYGTAVWGLPLKLTVDQADLLAPALGPTLDRPEAVIMTRRERVLTPARVHGELRTLQPARTYTIDQLLRGAAPRMGVPGRRTVRVTLTQYSIGVRS